MRGDADRDGGRRIVQLNRLHDFLGQARLFLYQCVAGRCRLRLLLWRLVVRWRLSGGCDQRRARPGRADDFLRRVDVSVERPLEIGCIAGASEDSLSLQRASRQVSAHRRDAVPLHSDREDSRLGELLLVRILLVFLWA